jgi:glycine/D-amino acid oxidase-like deaminating enzyme
MHKSAVVLGAGIQGVAAALALSRDSWRVTLVEQDDEPLNRASLRNEGKIHLGFVYANDATDRTPRLMLECAMSFGGLLEEWLRAPLPWDKLRSRPFTYCLATTSLVPAHVLESRYQSLQDYFLATDGPRRKYLGRSLRCLYTPLTDSGSVPELQSHFATPFITTPEVAIRLPAFCETLTRAVADEPSITMLCGHQVRDAERRTSGFRVSGTRADGTTWEAGSDILVNCLWENRLALDATLGIAPRRPWVHRLKYRVLATLPPALARLPSLTFVLGAYGDIVTYADGSSYLSYYPEAMRGWCSDLSPPTEWQEPCRGNVPASTTRELTQRLLTALQQAVPGIASSAVTHVDAGVIFAWGTTDIDDKDSELHTRHDTGVNEHDGYFSIDTGKFTCAPFYAQQLVTRV